MIAGLFPPAMIFVDTCTHQPVGGFGGQEEVVDAKACVALPCACLIVPEGPERGGGVKRIQCIGPAVAEQSALGRAAFGLHQSIVTHGIGIRDVCVGRNDVIIARNHRRHFAREKVGGA